MTAAAAGQVTLAQDLFLTGNTVYDSLRGNDPAALEALGLLAVGTAAYPLFRRARRSAAA